MLYEVFAVEGKWPVEMEHVDTPSFIGEQEGEHAAADAWTHYATEYLRIDPKTLEDDANDQFDDEGGSSFGSGNLDGKVAQFGLPQTVDIKLGGPDEQPPAGSVEMTARSEPAHRRTPTRPASPGPGGKNSW